MNYWETQPVCKLSENLTNEDNIGYINTSLSLSLSHDMYLISLDIHMDIDDISAFLRQHYKSKTLYTDSFMRFICDNYSHFVSLGIKKQNNLIAYILVCKPVFRLQQNKEFDAPFVNTVCIHNDYRGKGLMKYIISEALKYCSQNNYTMGTFITNTQIKAKPFLSSTCYQRIVNPKKVYKSGLIKTDVDIKTFMKYNDVFMSDKNETDYEVIIKRSKIDDIPYMFDIYNKYMDKYNVYQKYSLEQFTKLMTNPIVESYLIADKSTPDKFDFVMIYKTLIRCDNDDLSRYNIFMYTSLFNTSYMLLKYLLIIAKPVCDVVSICGNYENDIHLLDLKFTQTNDKFYWFHYNKKILEQKELYTAITPIF